jgi:hypothetical protein
LSFDGPYLLAPLPTLLGIRPGMRLCVLNPPEGFLQKLAPLPEGVELLLDSRTGLDVTIFFGTRKTELVEHLPKLVRGMAVTGGIWICFPTEPPSPAAPTEDFVRLAALEVGLIDTKKVLLDAHWSALRLAWKPRPRVDKPRVEA